MDTRPPLGGTGSRRKLGEGSAQIRVMIVDDSLTVRTVFSRMIDEATDMQVVACERSAESALGALRTIQADVVLLDLEMPGMGGLDALPQILSSNEHTAVLVVSSLTEAGAEHTLTALSMGAADTMAKPQSGGFDLAYRASLMEKIRALAERRFLRAAEPKLPDTSVRAKWPGSRAPKLIAIGASTGGIHALNILLRKLHPSFDLPICITQHLPAQFAPIFARQIEVTSARRTVVAKDGTRLEPGHITIAPGDAHLEVEQRGGDLFARLSHLPAPSGCIPSVDPMLRSIAESCAGRAIGVILSGMGRDGVLGAEALVSKRGMILAQDAASASVWGMPGAVVSAGIAAAALPPDEIANALMTHCRAT